MSKEDQDLNQMLAQACKNVDSWSVARLLSMKADANSGVLIYALDHPAENLHLPVIQSLIEAKADVNRGRGYYDLRLPYFGSRFHEFPLPAASAGGFLGAVQCLVEAKAEINKMDINKSYTPLVLAVENNHIDVARYLVHSKADVNLGTENLLCLASSNGDLPMVKFLVDEAKVKSHLKEGKESEDSSVLVSAASGGNVAVARYLIERFNIKINEFHVLAAAADKERLAMVRFLIKNGAIVDKTLRDEDDFEATPLNAAVHRGNLPIVKCLVEEGKADLTLLYRNKSVSQQARERGNEVEGEEEKQKYKAIADYLAPLEARVKPKIPEGGIMAQIEKKIQQGEAKEIKTIFSRAPQNDQNVQQFLQNQAVNTVLMTKLPVDKKRELLEEMINQGASVTAPNPEGQRPIDLARKTESAEIMVCLQRAEILESQQKEKKLVKELEVGLPPASPTVAEISFAEAMTTQQFISVQKTKQQGMQQLRNKLMPSRSIPSAPPPRPIPPAPKVVATPFIPNVQYPLTAEQKQQLIVIQGMLELMISDFFIRSLAIAHGLADDSQLKVSGKLADLVDYLGSMIPLPCVPWIVKLLTIAAKEHAAKKSKEKHEKQSLQINSLRQAADIVDALVHGLCCRYQLIIVQLAPESVESFAMSLVQRMFSYLSLLSNGKATIDTLGGPLVDLTQPSSSVSTTSQASKLMESDILNIAKNMVVGTSLWISSASKWRMQTDSKSMLSSVAKMWNRKVVEPILSDDNAVLFKPSAIAQPKSTTVEKLARYSATIGMIGRQRYRHCHNAQQPDAKIQQEISGAGMMFVHEEEADLRQFNWSTPWPYQLYIDPEKNLLVVDPQILALQAEIEKLKEENAKLKIENQQLQTRPQAVQNPLPFQSTTSAPAIPRPPAPPPPLPSSSSGVAVPNIFAQPAVQGSNVQKRPVPPPPKPVHVQQAGRGLPAGPQPPSGPRPLPPRTPGGGF